MKKISLLLLAFMPMFAFAAQAGASDASDLIGGLMIIILYFAFVVLLFFLVRRFWLWYFKIDVHIKNQEKMLEILAEMNGKMNKNVITSSSQTIIEEDDDEIEDDGSIKVGDLVVIIATEKQARVTSIEKGLYECKTNQGQVLEGYFKRTDIKPFGNS